MTILANPATAAMPARAPITVPIAMAPPRLNFAGFCGYCGTRGCSDPACITRYRSSRWAVCPSCGGNDERDGAGCDMCLYGVIEVHPNHPGAVQPR